MPHFDSVEHGTGRVDRTLPGASLIGGMTAMVTIWLKPKANGSLSIHRCHITLFSDLQLGLAIKLAREMARDEHLRLGREFRVEMPGPISCLALASHPLESLDAERRPSNTGTMAA
jgi:hypothetical protein